MSATFTPTPVEQKTYTQPASGDNKDVSSILPFLQGLADGLAALPRIGENWLPKATSAHNLQRGTWSVREQAWYAVAPGGNDAADVSYDGGRTWAAITPGSSTLACEDCAASSSAGHVVIINSGSRSVYKGTYSGFGSVAWSTTTNALSVSPTAGTPKVTFDPVHAAWVVAYRNGSSGMKAEASTNGTAYTAATLPTAWSGYTGTAAAPQLLANELGTTVAWFYDNVATLFRIMFSADGGATWTESTSIAATTFTPAVVGKPAYESVLGEWYLVASKTSTRQTQVLRSTDGGVSWIDVGCATSDMALQDVVAVNGILVGVNDDGRIYRSTDRGVTWALVTTNPITSAARPYLRKGDGQLVVWNAADKTIFATLRMGASPPAT